MKKIPWLEFAKECFSNGLKKSFLWLSDMILRHNTPLMNGIINCDLIADLVILNEHGLSFATKNQTKKQQIL